MVSRSMFSTSVRNRATKTDTINLAGGQAYSTSAEHDLCQFVVTGTFNNTYYASSDDQLNEVKKIVSQVHSNTIAKAAVYGHKNGKMKDMPAYLLAELAARGEIELVKKIFPKIITNMKMLCNFVQIIRSGVTGRKSFGTAIKRLIQNWLTDKNPTDLWKSGIGHSNPSLADIIKMVHPKTKNAQQNAIFAYILGKDCNFDDIGDGDVAGLPSEIHIFEWFKIDTNGPIPNVPFQALSNIKMSQNQWCKLAENMPWNTLRLNLNQLNRNGVFNNKELTRKLAQKLADPINVKKHNVFPYQLMTAYMNTNDVPQEIKVALSDALDASAYNVPTIDGGVAICCDVSGSMTSPITGNRPGSTSVVQCKDVAALIAACFVKHNVGTQVIAWDHRALDVTNRINPRDSIITICNSLKCPGGATDSGVALKLLNQQKSKHQLVFYISDNESWYGHKSSWGNSTGMAQEWEIYKKRNPEACLICLDIQPYSTVQVPDGKNVLNIGGMSNDVFDIVNRFVNFGHCNFVEIIDEVEL